MLESKLCHKINQKIEGCKDRGFNKTCDQYPHKFNFGHFFFSSIVSFSPPPPRFFLFFAHKMLSGEMGTFPSAWEVMIKTWGSVAWGHG